MKQWQSLPPTRGRWPQVDEPQLRILTDRIGYLNICARRFLFDGAKSGKVDFQRREDGPFSVVAVPEGLPVSAVGKVTVTRLTHVNPGQRPVTILLQALPALNGQERRLIFAGVKPE